MRRARRGSIKGALAALAALTFGCGAPSAPGDCQGSLRGRWRADDGRSWTVLDLGPRVEIYPAFDDSGALPPRGEALVWGPRHLELVRTNGALVGHVDRWVMHRGQACTQRAPARISACIEGSLDLALGELTRPRLDDACPSAPPSPPAAQRWRRRR